MNDHPTQHSTHHGATGADVSALMERILFEVKKIVVGQDHFLERVLVAILAQGHLLVEGVPGLAKTLTVKTLATTIQGHFRRIQFTPDLVPADLIGTRIYSQKTGEFSTALGPVFTNLLRNALEAFRSDDFQLDAVLPEPTDAARGREMFLEVAEAVLPELTAAQRKLAAQLIREKASELMP